MFWWSVPFAFTGLLIAAISLVITLIICLLVDNTSLDDARGFRCVLGAGAMFVLIGLAMALLGYFFWALGDIWGPYL